MVKITIDGEEVQAREEITVLELAGKLGIEIPTLCYHQALTPSGACRLCIVEVIRGKRSRLVTSCLYPIREESIIINTNSPAVIKARRMILELLLARCPNSIKIKELAQQMGIEKPRFKSEDEECILCGLCVRVCQEVIGRSAIGFVNRGSERKVSTPFHSYSDLCIGCGACALICPTEAIKIEDIEGRRILHTWHTEVELKSCKICGHYFAPGLELDQLKNKLNLPDDFFEICLNCRRKSFREILRNIKASAQEPVKRFYNLAVKR